MKYLAEGLVLDMTRTPLRSSTNAWITPNTALQRLSYCPIPDHSDKNGIFSFSPFSSPCGTFLLPEAVADSHRNNRKEAGIAEVMVVPRFEGGEVLLEARVLIDRLAAH